MTAIRIRKAKATDSLRLWRWRNEPSVRKVSFHSKPIPLAQHKKWFPEKLKDIRSQILIGENGSGKPFGYVRIDKKSTHSGEIHIAIQKASRGKGFGELLLKKACHYGFKKMRLRNLLAQIKPENKRSIQLFTSLGFKPAAKNKQAYHLRCHE